MNSAICSFQVHIWTQILSLSTQNFCPSFCFQNECLVAAFSFSDEFERNGKRGVGHLNQFATSKLFFLFFCLFAVSLFLSSEIIYFETSLFLWLQWNICWDQNQVGVSKPVSHYRWRTVKYQWKIHETMRNNEVVDRNAGDVTAEGYNFFVSQTNFMFSGTYGILKEILTIGWNLAFFFT